MNISEELHLLQDAVAAKITYWDANLALEKALAGEDIADVKANEIEEQISILASSLNFPQDAYKAVNEEHLSLLKGLL